MNLEELEEALEGHQVLSVNYARMICEWLEIPFSDGLIVTWINKEQALREYGFVPKHEKGTCVHGLNLSYHVCKELGIEPAPGHMYTGKGFQTRVNFEEIKKVLMKKGVL